MSAAEDPLHTVHLPAVFEPRYIAACDSAQSQAERLAAAGAPEGTLIWAGSQSAAYGRLGSTWLSPPDGLYCAIVLRPQLEAARWGEFVPLATVALGAACAEQVLAMTDLRYRWPNAVYLGGARVSGAWLSAGADWLVLTTAANIRQTPAKESLQQGCLSVEGGNAEITVTNMLEAYTRHLLSWLARWDEQGFSPVWRSFCGRAHLPPQASALRLANGEHITGTAQSITADGSLRLQTDYGDRDISINAYLGLPNH